MPLTVDILRSSKSLCFIDSIEKNSCLEKMSDFELFAYVCSNFQYIRESSFAAAFISSLEQDIGDKIVLGRLGCRELQKSLWRRMHGDDSDLSFISDNKISAKPIELSFYGYQDITEYVKSQIANSQSLEDLIDKMPYNILLNTSVFKFKKPDEYHATLCYAAARDEKSFSEEEWYALIVWMLCRKAIKGHLCLLVRIYGGTEFKSLIEYFATRKISADIYVTPTLYEEKALDDLSTLILSMHKIKKDAFPLVAVNEKASDKVLQVLSVHLPISRICKYR